MIKAVIFDLYDTLIRLRTDSTPFQQLARRTSVFSLRQAIEIALTTDNLTLEAYASRIGLPPQEDLSSMEAELKGTLSEVELFPDVLSTLNRMKQRGIIAGVISNLATPYKRPFYTLQLDNYFDAAVFSCDCGFLKPNAKIFEAALVRMDAKAHDTLMVGDSYSSDVKGAANAGLIGIHLVRSGEASPASTSISTLNSLFDMLK
jgi:HAD superfamily hydrolase (TIGR01549 family)